MAEVKRILTASRTILCFCICLLLSWMFFVYECGIEKYITAQGEELDAYVESYPAFLVSVDHNAKDFGSIASMQGRFPENNIAKTADDYASLDTIQIRAGENRSIVLYSDYLTADLLFAALVVIVVTGFSEENKKGLANLIRSTKYGRQHLSAQRCGAVVIVSLLFAFAVCFGCMLVGSIMFGDAQLSRPIQSIPEFRLCAMPISIAGYLLISCLMKALAASIVGLLTYLFSALFDSIIAAVIAAALVVSQYLTYSLISPVDRIAVLKFCNIIALMKSDVFFKNYLNLNLFGNAVGFLNAVLTVFIVLFILAVFLCIAFTSGRAGSRTIGEKTAEKIRRFFSKREPARSLGAWELRKVFISQKGMLILIGVLYIALFSSMQYRYVYSVDPYLAMYYNRFSGVITQEQTEQISEKRMEYEAKVIELDAAYQKALLINDDRAGELYVKLMEALNHYDALVKIEEQAYSGLEYSEESGIEVELIKPDAYELLYVRDTATTERNCMYILFAIIGIFAGIIARERQNNMRELQRSLKRGRGRMLASKIIILFFTCVFISLSVNAVQTVQIGISAGYNDLSAPAQSLEFLRGINQPMTVLQYMILIFVLRALGAFIIGLIVMLISRNCKNTIVSLSVSAAVLVIPALLDSLGIKRVLSVIDFLGISVLE